MRRKTLVIRIGKVTSKPKIQNSKLGSAIIPLILGDEAKAVAAAMELREQDIFVPAIRFPTVARGAARLRITLTATHSEADVAKLAHALGYLKLETSNLKSP